MKCCILTQKLPGTCIPLLCGHPDQRPTPVIFHCIWPLNKGHPCCVATKCVQKGHITGVLLYLENYDRWFIPMPSSNRELHFNRFGSKSLRIFRLLLLKKHLEQKQVSGLETLNCFNLLCFDNCNYWYYTRTIIMSYLIVGRYNFKRFFFHVPAMSWMF